MQQARSNVSASLCSHWHPASLTLRLPTMRSCQLKTKQHPPLCLCRRAMRCPRTTSRAAAAAETARQQSATTAGSGHNQQQQHAHALGVVLLLSENVRRRTGRALLQREQLLKGVELLEASAYACIVLGPSTAAAACSVLYANAAARDVLLPKQQQQQCQKGQQLCVPAVIADLVKVLQQQQQQQQQCSVMNDLQWQLSPEHSPLQQQERQQQEQLALQLSQVLCVPLTSPNDAPFGLALLFDAWSWSDGARGVPGWPRVLPGELPSEAGLQQAADSVRQLADVVRQLKTQQGLGNKDLAVVAAVEQLQSAKQELARLEGLREAFCADSKQSQLQQLVTAVQEGRHAPASLAT